MTTLRRALRLLPALLLVAASSLAASFPARVVGVTSGDTITVLRETQEVQIRLYGIDAPEEDQAFGHRAEQFAADLALGREVVVHDTGRRRWDRMIGWVVFPDGRSLNKEILRAGMAWWFRKYAEGDRELESLEAEARAADRGLWKEPDPVPPWEFRKRRRAQEREEAGR